MIKMVKHTKKFIEKQKRKRPSGTWHILKQVEWYNRLKSEYGCSKVEMEFTLEIPQKHIVRNHYRIDVYGESKDKIFIIEIGNINQHKLKYLESLAGSEDKITFIHVSK